ncbi:MAG: hypothetical protein ACE5LU_20275, partial [Anaerolineae bacterium]
MIRRYLFPHARPHWPRIALAGCSLVASTALGLLKPWPLKFLFDRVITSSAKPETEAITWLLLLIGGAIVFIAA